MTREQMVSEFGEPGVENPAVVDLIELDAESDRVVLAMVERRAWNGGPRQLSQIEEKINRYLAYVLDGHLAAHYPRYAGKRARLRLDCAEPPHGSAVTFVAAAEHAVNAQGLEFVVRVTPPSAA